MLLVDSLPLAALVREEGPSVTGWLFLVALIGVGLAIVLGNVLSKALKYKEHSTRISVVLTTVVIALMPFVAQVLLGNAEQSQYADATNRWESLQNRNALSDDAVKELKEENPKLEVRR